MCDVRENVVFLVWCYLRILWSDNRFCVFVRIGIAMWLSVRIAVWLSVIGVSEVWCVWFLENVAFFVWCLHAKHFGMVIGVGCLCASG